MHDNIASMWPEVSARVAKALRSRGVESDRLPDLLQEVALRVVRAQPEVESADDLAAWCYVVARRLVIDSGRTRPTVPLPDDIDICTTIDLNEHVESRIELERTWRAMADLSDGDRSILLATIESPQPVGNRQSVIREAVRRYRARARLAAAVDRLAAAAAGMALRMRRLVDASTGTGLALGLSIPAVVVALAVLPAEKAVSSSLPPVPVSFPTTVPPDSATVAGPETPPAAPIVEQPRLQARPDPSPPTTAPPAGHPPTTTPQAPEPPEPPRLLRLPPTNFNPLP